MTKLINKYPIRIIKQSQNRKKYAVGLLVYPGIKDPKWNYLFGACMISQQLKTEEWFKKNCDIIILTPEIDDPIVLSLIHKVFDVHAIYLNTLNIKFSFKTNPRWYGVFNKLYYWNKDIFNYKRVLILDTDIYILKPEKYIYPFTSITGIVAGCYENGFLYKNQDIDLSKINTLIPDKYTYYKWTDNKTYYNMINAGVISLIPDSGLFSVMLEDLEKGWNELGSKYPSLRYKKNNFVFPEQEYLTGIFSGYWRSLPSNYLSCSTTEYHYSPHAKKYWEKFPPLYGSHRSIIIESKRFVETYQESIIIFDNIINNINGTLDQSKHYNINTNIINQNSTENIIVIAPTNNTINHKNIKNIADITNIVKINKTAPLKYTPINTNNKNNLLVETKQFKKHNDVINIPKVNFAITHQKIKKHNTKVKNIPDISLAISQRIFDKNNTNIKDKINIDNTVLLLGNKETKNVSNKIPQNITQKDTTIKKDEYQGTILNKNKKNKYQMGEERIVNQKDNPTKNNRQAQNDNENTKNKLNYIAPTAFKKKKNNNNYEDPDNILYNLNQYNSTKNIIDIDIDKLIF